MKLIIAGSTGFVATALIRQAISNPNITSIIALARRVTAVPPNAGPDSAKLKSVVCEDFNNYSENVKKDLASADACIWLIAVTPSQLKTIPFEEVRKICLDYAVTGIETISQLSRIPEPQNPLKPFRFIYISGANSERDQTKKPWVLGDYCLMRGETETRILDYATKSKGAVEACIAKPGLIDAPGRTGVVAGIAMTIFRSFIGLPKIDVSHISAALLNQAITGFEKETLLNEDLIRIGSKALVDQKISS